MFQCSACPGMFLWQPLALTMWISARFQCSIYRPRFKQANCIHWDTATPPWQHRERDRTIGITRIKVCAPKLLTKSAAPPLRHTHTDTHHDKSSQYENANLFFQWPLFSTLQKVNKYKSLYAMYKTKSLYYTQIRDFVVSKLTKTLLSVDKYVNTLILRQWCHGLSTCSYRVEMQKCHRHIKILWCKWSTSTAGVITLTAKLTLTLHGMICQDRLQVHNAPSRDAISRTLAGILADVRLSTKKQWPERSQNLISSELGQSRVGGWTLTFLQLKLLARKQKTIGQHIGRIAQTAKGLQLFAGLSMTFPKRNTRTLTCERFPNLLVTQ